MGCSLAFPWRRHARQVSADGGQALVEFAVVIPLLFLLVFGIIKFGIVYNNYIQLTNAVDSGARLFSEERGLPNSCTDAANEVVTSAGGLTVGSLTISMQDVTTGSTQYVVSGGNTSSPISGTCPSLNAGDASQVSATYPCDLTIFGINFAPGCSLTASAKEYVQ